MYKYYNNVTLMVLFSVVLKSSNLTCDN